MIQFKNILNYISSSKLFPNVLWLCLIAKNTRLSSNLKTMKTETKPTENTAENGNKSNPLLPDISSSVEIKVISINKNTEKEKKDYTDLVLKHTKSF